jgi:hypothetical protein
MTLVFSIYLLILTIITLNGIVRFNKLTVPFKVLTVLMLITLISEITSRILVARIRNSNPPYHILVILEFAATAFIYSRLITGWRLHKLVLLSIIPFTILSVANTLFVQNFLSFPSLPIMLSYIIFIAFALILFIQMLDSPKEITIFKQSVFWFNSAILIYSVTVPICFGVLNYMTRHHLNNALLGDLLLYFTLIYYLTIGYAIHIDKKQGNRHISGVYNE